MHCSPDKESSTTWKYRDQPEYAGNKRPQREHETSYTNDYIQDEAASSHLRHHESFVPVRLAFLQGAGGHAASISHRAGCLLWVKSGLPVPHPFMSARGGKADIKCPLSEAEGGVADGRDILLVQVRLGAALRHARRPPIKLRWKLAQ